MRTKTYGPFTQRDELTQLEEALNRTHGIIFISDAESNDWYELQKLFSVKSLKVVFDENGIINSASYDASTLWPEGYFVAEVITMPEGFSLPVSGGKWIFRDKAISGRVLTDAELSEQAAMHRDEMMASATAQIDPRKDAVELGRASDDEKALLLAWMNHRIDLLQLDISVPSAIVWPEAPADVA